MEVDQTATATIPLWLQIDSRQNRRYLLFSTRPTFYASPLTPNP